MVKCPKCKVAYRKVKTTFESGGVFVQNVEALRCPKCGDELFSPEQAAEIRKKIEHVAPSLRIERKISSAAGKKPIIYLPREILAAAGLKIGDVVKMGLEGKKRVVITPA